MAKPKLHGPQFQSGPLLFEINFESIYEKINLSNLSDSLRIVGWKYVSVFYHIICLAYDIQQAGNQCGKYKLCEGSNTLARPQSQQVYSCTISSRYLTIQSAISCKEIAKLMTSLFSLLVAMSDTQHMLKDNFKRVCLN